MLWKDRCCSRHLSGSIVAAYLCEFKWVGFSRKCSDCSVYFLLCCRKLALFTPREKLSALDVIKNSWPALSVYIKHNEREEKEPCTWKQYKPTVLNRGLLSLSPVFWVCAWVIKVQGLAVQQRPSNNHPSRRQQRMFVLRVLQRTTRKPLRHQVSSRSGYEYWKEKKTSLFA